MLKQGGPFDDADGETSGRLVERKRLKRLPQERQRRVDVENPSVVGVIAGNRIRHRGSLARQPVLGNLDEVEGPLPFWKKASLSVREP